MQKQNRKKANKISGVSQHSLASKLPFLWGSLYITEVRIRSLRMIL